MTRIMMAFVFFFAAAVAAGAGELGDDGLYKEAWMRDTFKDLREDLKEANASGRRLMVVVEQRGCGYCKQMHEEVFVREDISAMLNDKFFVVQINMFGDVEVTDFDGKALTEKQAANRWGLLFTPTLIFFPEEVPEGVTAAQAAVAVMPGAFGPGTTLDLFTWILEKGYEGEENFQKYHQRNQPERAEHSLPMSVSCGRGRECSARSGWRSTAPGCRAAAAPEAPGVGSIPGSCRRRRAGRRRA